MNSSSRTSSFAKKTHTLDGPLRRWRPDRCVHNSRAPRGWFVVDTATGQHAEIVDCPCSCAGRCGPLNQQIGRLGGSFASLPKKARLMSTLAYRTRRSLENSRAPLQLLHAIGHSDVAGPAVLKMVEHFQRPGVVANSAFQQFSACSCAEVHQASTSASVRAREDAARYWL